MEERLRAYFELHYDMDLAGCPLDGVIELLLGFVPGETRRLTGGAKATPTGA